MSRMLSDEASAFLTATSSHQELDAWKQSEAVKVLEVEFNSFARLGLGFVSLVLLTIGGVSLGGAFDSFEGDTGLAVIALVIAAATIGAGAWLGSLVIRAGAQVVEAYRSWLQADPNAVVHPWSIYQRALSGRGLLRSALTAFALIVAVFGWTFLVLGLVPSDPAGLGSSQSAMIGIGLIWGIAFSASTWVLLSGELRIGRAHSAAVIGSA